MKNLVIGIFVGALLVLIGYGAFLFGQNLNIFLPSRIASSPQPSAIPIVEKITENPVEINTNEIQDENFVLIQSEIMKSISNKNYSGLSGLLPENVEVILYASECCGTITKEGAINQLKYLDTATPPWKFGSDISPIKELALKDPVNFGVGNIAGASGNKMAVSFKIGSDAMISRIFIVGNYDLLLN